MMNIGKMMGQVKEMQSKMGDFQAKLVDMTTEGEAAGGLVKAVVTGKGDLQSIKIDPKAVDTDDLEMLEDLIVAACRDAKGKSDAMVAEESEKIMGGLKLPPGLNLPF